MPPLNIEPEKCHAPLSVERVGSGPALVFLHGWGMSRRLFKPLAQAVATQHTSWLIDMPGYGRSAPLINGEQLDVYADYIVAQLALNSAVDLCGWSMGGLVALNIAARYPHFVQRLLLFTATPCFQRHDHWLHGVHPDVLAQFAAELTEDYAQTFSRFLTLQYKNVPQAREQLREVKVLLSNEPKPPTSILQQGLQL